MLGYSARGSRILNISGLGFEDGGAWRSSILDRSPAFIMNGSRTPRPEDWSSLHRIKSTQNQVARADRDNNGAEDEGEAIGSLVWTFCLRGSC